MRSGRTLPRVPSQWATGPVHVITDAPRQSIAQQLAHPRPLPVVRDEHARRAEAITTPVAYLTYRLYAVAAVAVAAVAYSAVWVVSTPGRLGAALAFTAVAAVSLALL